MFPKKNFFSSYLIVFVFVLCSVMDSEDSASEDSHPSTDASEDSVEVRVRGVIRPPAPQAPLLSLIQSGLPPKLRKSYAILATDSLIKPSPIAAFATASYDRIPTKNAPIHDTHEDILPHPRRRKLAEPRRLCAEGARKRPHSPDLRSHHTSLLVGATSPQDVSMRPLKVPKLSSPAPPPSPPLSITRTPSPQSTSSSKAQTSVSAPPLIHPSILSPLIRPPALSPTLSSSFPSTLSPTLSSTLASHLLPQGWPRGHSYHHFQSILPGVLSSPLALLPHYPIVPLLNLPPPSVQSPPPHVPRQPPKLQASKEPFIPNPLQHPGLGSPVQDEPVSLVKREEKHLFSSVLSLVGNLTEKEYGKTPSKSKHSTPSPAASSLASSSSKTPARNNSKINQQNILHKIKEEPPPDIQEPTSVSRLPGSKSKNSAAVAGGLLPDSPAKLSSSSSNPNQQQSQQQQMRNKQRNYKNMTRERRIEANARERTRVHTISSAYEKLRQSIPSYSHNQKLSKLSILRIAASYINTLSKLADDSPEDEQANCVEDTTRTIQFEGRAKKKRDDWVDN